jgi:hypothetical protein
MRKTYRYRNLSCLVKDDEKVNFTVEFVSDGNTGQTLVNVPGPNDPEILDSGTAYIGKGKSLRGDTTICFSDVANLIPEEDTIKIKYMINDQLICEHSNKKTEEKQPIIILFIKFLKS